MDAPQAPKENLEIYCHLYEIETSLRELIIDSLQSIAGPFWYKIRLPGDVLEKYRSAVAFERSIPWTQVVPSHPIYYVDFPDLKKIVEREDNWRDVFRSVFSHKEMLTATFRELELIRNKVAHNRKASTQDVAVVSVAYARISQWLGSQRFHQLSFRYTSSTDLAARISVLERECSETFRCIQELAPVLTTKVWQSISLEWWFDESYLGQDLSSIRAYFETVQDYAGFPRTRGSGHVIESWVKTAHVEQKYRDSIQRLSEILSSGR